MPTPAPVAPTPAPVTPAPVAPTLPDIVDTAAAAGLDTLMTALAAAGLTNNLRDTSTDYTIFAPTDEAFEQLPPGYLNYFLSNAAPDALPLLSQILLYHVLAFPVRSLRLLINQQLDTLQGESLSISVDVDDALFVNQARVLTDPVETSNGVVHVIDGKGILLHSDFWFVGEVGVAVHVSNFDAVICLLDVHRCIIVPQRGFEDTRCASAITRCGGYLSRFVVESFLFPDRPGSKQFGGQAS